MVVGRIRGVIQSALSADAAVQAHLIVTNQPPTEKNGYPTDTIHAFDLVQAWLSHQDRSLFATKAPQLSLVKNQITFSAIDEDKLHEYYYALFQHISPNETVYLSVKGGTHQMQQALKVQALASNTRAQIFLSPKPRVLDILAGKPSECQRVTYWRYQQNQRYQTVQLLLARWDFEGAAAVLLEWQATLQALLTDESISLQHQRKAVARTINGLQMAVAHMNLDLQAVENLQQEDAQLISFSMQFSDLENLYAQCKIYAELKQISHFLSRLGSFYEATQNRLIQVLGGLSYIDTEKSGPWAIMVSAVQQDAPELWQLLEKPFIKRFKHKRPDTWQLGNRFDKRAYLIALIRYKYGELAVPGAPSLDYWRKLDFWYGVRNQLIHGAKGINEDRLAAVHQQREAKHQIACTYEEILPTMRLILSAIDRVESPTGSTEGPQREPEYGLYGCIRQWAIATLKR